MLETVLILLYDLVRLSGFLCVLCEKPCDVIGWQPATLGIIVQLLAADIAYPEVSCSRVGKHQPAY